MKKSNIKVMLLSVMLVMFIPAITGFAQTPQLDYEKLKKEYEAVKADRDNLLLQAKNLGDYKNKFSDAESAVKKAQEEKAKRIGQLWAGMNWPKALIVTLALLAYTLTFTYLGFLLGTIALLMFFLKVVDPVRWLTAVGVAILASFISFAVFVLWLQVQLPRGIIERFLF